MIRTLSLSVALFTPTDLESVRVREARRLAERTGFFHQQMRFSFDPVVRTLDRPVDAGHARPVGRGHRQGTELAQLDPGEIHDLLRGGARLTVGRREAEVLDHRMVCSTPCRPHEESSAKH